MLGVNLSGAEFGKSHRYGYDYIYPSEADIAAYAARGAELIRLPFKWERMQTDLGGSLNGAELGRLKTFLDAAERQGVEVVLDLHNYGRYGDKVLGTAELPKQVFADFWAKLAANVGSHKAIYGYGLMNEPHDLGSDTVWPEAAQAAVNAIRAIDKTNTIIVGGDAWSSANMWKAANQKLNIYDSADNILYEAHVYFDNDGSGVYNEGYDAEGAYPNIGVDRLKNFVEWLDERGARGFIGEFAVPDTDPRWAPVLDNFLAAIESVGLDATYWGAGPWFGDYSLGLMKKDGTERPQLDVLEKYFGTAQGQVIDGSDGSETIVGGRGDDIIYARGGDDVVLPSLGADWIDGGLGSDTVSYQHDFYGVDVDLRRDVQFGGNAAGDRLRGVENLIGTGASDRLAGDDGANVLKGLGGVDWLQGGAGADTLDGGDGEDTVSYADSAAGVRVDLGKAVQAGGSAEGDRLIAIENVIGSRFDDLLAGNAGNNKLSGGAGNDRFLAVAGGSDVIDGGSGYDIYDASMSTVSVKLNLQAGGNKWLRLSSIEELRGGSAIDELRGDGGANRLVGNAGNDLLDGAGGADVMDGGMGNDSYWVDNTADKVIERPGEGTDIVHASASFVLPANVEKMILVGSAAINGTGNALGNRIEGNSASNVLLGMDGADYLFGGAGGDRLDGGAGMDRLTGGAGADWLIGGLDADRFIFSNADLGSGQDTIADFSRSQGDLIDLWGIDADAGLVGDQRFIYVGQAMFSRQAGELRTVSLDGGVQVQGDINGDGLADFSLMVQWVDSLAARDFIL